MLDRFLAPLLTRALQPAALKVFQSGMSANKLTLIGFAVAMAGCFCIGLQNYMPGLILIGVSRFIDGINGMVARQTAETPLGAMLDTLCDFISYAAFAFFFMLAAPQHSMAAALLIFSYLVMGMAYGGHQLLAVKTNGIQPARGGLIGDSEIFIFMALCCLYPSGFSAFALMFAIACFVTAGLRIVAALRTAKSII